MFDLSPVYDVALIILSPFILFMILYIMGDGLEDNRGQPLKVIMKDGLVKTGITVLLSILVVFLVIGSVEFVKVVF